MGSHDTCFYKRCCDGGPAACYLYTNPADPTDGFAGCLEIYYPGTLNPRCCSFTGDNPACPGWWCNNWPAFYHGPDLNGTVPVPPPPGVATVGGAAKPQASIATVSAAAASASAASTASVSDATVSAASVSAASASATAARVVESPPKMPFSAGHAAAGEGAAAVEGVEGGEGGESGRRTVRSSDPFALAAEIASGLSAIAPATARDDVAALWPSEWWEAATAGLGEGLWEAIAPLAQPTEDSAPPLAVTLAANGMPPIAPNEDPAALVTYVAAERLGFKLGLRAKPPGAPAPPATPLGVALTAAFDSLGSALVAAPSTGDDAAPIAFNLSVALSNVSFLAEGRLALNGTGLLHMPLTGFTEECVPLLIASDCS